MKYNFFLTKPKFEYDKIREGSVGNEQSKQRQMKLDLRFVRPLNCTKGWTNFSKIFSRD